jgi:hypothetical protein
MATYRTCCTAKRGWHTTLLQTTGSRRVVQGFFDRIAGIVVRSITSYPYTAFIEVVEGATGKTNVLTTILVTEAMKKQKLARQ